MQGPQPSPLQTVNTDLSSNPIQSKVYWDSFSFLKKKLRLGPHGGEQVSQLLINQDSEISM